MGRVVAKAAKADAGWHRRATGVAVLAVLAVPLLPTSNLQTARGNPSDYPTDEETTASVDGQAPEVLVNETPVPTVQTAEAGKKRGPEPSEFDVPVPDVVGPRFAVLPFENRSGVSRLDWLGPAAAFVAGELTSAHRGVRPAFGSTVVPRGQVALATPGVIASYAALQQADFIITGTYSRPNWKLELAVELWKVDAGSATRVGLVVNQGEFKEVHRFLGSSLLTLWEKAGHPVVAADIARLSRQPTADFYAFTVFGRGLAGFLAAEKNREFAAAGKNLRRAILIDPKLREAHRMLGEYYRLIGRRLRASTRSHPRDGKALGADASSAPKLAAFAFVRALADSSSTGASDASRAPKAPKAQAAIGGAYVPALVALAQLAEERDDLEVARDNFFAALQHRPYDFELRYRLGKLLWDVGQAADSYAVLQTLVEHQPDDVRARRILVMIHSARGSGEALVSELEAVAKLDPHHERTRMDLAAAYAALGRNDEAIRTYGEIAERRPKNASALKFLGDLYQKVGKRSHAIKHYGLAMDADPSDPRSYFVLGAMYVEDGDEAKARSIYRRAQKFRRYAPQVHNNLGSIAMRANSVADALYHFDKAVSSAPRRARYRYNHGLALSSNGQLDKALAEVKRGLRLNHEHVELNYLKGVVHLRRGEINPAWIQFEKTLELSPEHAEAAHNLELIEDLRRRSEDGELVSESRR